LVLLVVLGVFGVLGVFDVLGVFGWGGSTNKINTLIGVHYLLF